MTPAQWVVIGVAGWFVISLLVALLVGGFINVGKGPRPPR